MAVQAVGGGSSAVAASSHSACARFRGTDPLVTGMTRRNLAQAVGFADTSGAIPQARWMRAMTFERLVRDESFAGQIATRTVGSLGLARPGQVVTVDAHTNVHATSLALSAAHQRAVTEGSTTIVFQLAVPFSGFEDTRATDVKPDFAVVAPSVDDPNGSWLVLGDAKDYERVRSRIDDARMLKGFLQVAVGAESARAWSRLPLGMSVHSFGVLAVPRNAFLQPVPVVENLHDYREEVRLRIDERRREAQESGYTHDQDVKTFVEHLEATFDPGACVTCTLFSFCRNELRRSHTPNDLLVEIGVGRDMRRHAVGLVDGVSPIGRVPQSTVANIEATLKGVARSTGQLRVDQAGAPGTINVVLAKSDAAALGVHGMGLQRVTADGRTDWEYTVFDDPRSPDARRLIARRVGNALIRAMRDQRIAAGSVVPNAVHLVVPDQVTADVLVSIADNLAGIELSRLRWQRDRDRGRPALTYDGEPAVIPRPISEAERTSIAFLLEDDRSRTFQLRSPVIDVRAVIARHFVVGGPRANAGRLDYLVGWCEALDSMRIDHRLFADEIEALAHTPGARTTNKMSDAIHEALVGKRGMPSGSGVADADLYNQLVTAELKYKAQTLERALDVVQKIPSSNIRAAYRAIESDAQVVWRRRLQLHASDLVRFGRTYRHWRNSLVPMIESDGLRASHLLALSNPEAASDLASDAGNRFVTTATVVNSEQLILEVASRRIISGTRVVMLTRNGTASVETAGIHVDGSPNGSVKIDGMAIGGLEKLEDTNPHRLLWNPQVRPAVEHGDTLVIADFAWFSDLKRNRYLTLSKPKQDNISAPTAQCVPESFEEDPQTHRWCCRSHEVSESEFSDQLAERRTRGELNPEVWPPVRDGDAFEVTGATEATGKAFDSPLETVPDDQTIDDLE